eukprot:167194-Amphidinium_carterae.1
MIPRGYVTPKMTEMRCEAARFEHGQDGHDVTMSYVNEDENSKVCRDCFKSSDCNATTPFDYKIKWEYTKQPHLPLPPAKRAFSCH